jgi:SNF2 family DNA or RNA helicase
MSIPYNPREYQLRGIQHLLEPEAGRALFLSPGMGKTSITLAAVSVLLDGGHIKRALVVAPRRPCYLVWPRELQKWTDFNHLKSINLHAIKPRDRADIFKGDEQIFIINYEGLKWLLPLCAAQKVWPFQVFVADESTKLKHTNTERFKNLKQYLHRFQRRWILTGTCAPQGIENLFGQVFVADLGARLGKFITHFRREYFFEFKHRDYSEWVIKPDGERRIQDKVRDLALTLLDKDYLNLPELVYNDVLVELPAAVRANYDALERDFYLSISRGEVTAANAAVKANKLRQLASGGVYTETESLWLHDEKLDALEDLIEEQSGEPLLVAIAFRQELDAIRKRLGYNVPYIGGGVSDAEADTLERDWNDGKLPVLIVNPASTAHGLNLQHGGHALCVFTQTWSVEDTLQLLKRLWRDGQTKQVVVTRLLVANSIEQRVAQVLETHGSTQDRLLNAFKRGS